MDGWIVKPSFILKTYFLSDSSTCSVLVSWFDLSLEKGQSPPPQARTGAAPIERANTKGRTFFTVNLKVETS